MPPSPSSRTFPGALSAARSGDARALDSLLSPHREWLAAHVRRQIRRPEDAEDLLQATLERAVRSFPSFRGETEAQLSCWLLRIASHRMLNYYERVLPKQARASSLEVPEEEGGEVQHAAREAGPEQQVQRQAQARRLMAAVAEACTEAEQSVLNLVYRGESLEEVAGLLEMKPATVRSHFHRARGKLLAHLVRHDPEFLGGEEALRDARAAASRADDEAERLTREEAAALDRPEGQAERFRAACLKLARHLPLPALLWICWMGAPGWTWN